MGPSLAKLYDVDNVWELSMEDRVDFVYALQGKIMKENIDKFTKQLDKYTEVSILVRLSYSNNIIFLLRKWGSMHAWGLVSAVRLLNL